VTLTGLIEADVRTDGAPPGSALVDASGAVVGIFAGPRRMAVPIDVARDVAEQLSATGQAAHGGLGVLGVDALDRNGGGVRVKALAPGSPAETSGLAVDDVITAVNDEDVTTVGDLMDALRRRKPQDPVQIVALRGNKRVTFNATLTRSSTLPSWPAPFG
jgi:S1-C subfamily serine protease